MLQTPLEQSIVIMMCLGEKKSVSNSNEVHALHVLSDHTLALFFQDAKYFAWCFGVACEFWIIRWGVFLEKELKSTICDVTDGNIDRDFISLRSVFRGTSSSMLNLFCFSTSLLLTNNYLSFLSSIVSSSHSALTLSVIITSCGLTTGQTISCVSSFNSFSDRHFFATWCHKEIVKKRWLHHLSYHGCSQTRVFSFSVRWEDSFC